LKLLTEQILFAEKLPRKSEKKPKQLLVTATTQGVIVKAVVPFLQQTPDFPKPILKQYDDNRCAYYAAYFLHVFCSLSLEDLCKLPSTTTVLPAKLEPLLDRAAFCEFFGKLLEWKPLTRPDDITGLDAATIHGRICGFFGGNRPLVLSVAVFRNCEQDPSFFETLEASGFIWPMIRDDLVRVKEFRDGGVQSVLPILLLDQKDENDLQATHWIPCILFRNQGDLTIIAADSYNEGPDEELVEKLALYILKG
jgi:hypothetical protein